MGSDAHDAEMLVFLIAISGAFPPPAMTRQERIVAYGVATSATLSQTAEAMQCSQGQVRRLRCRLCSRFEARNMEQLRTKLASYLRGRQ